MERLTAQLLTRSTDAVVLIELEGGRIVDVNEATFAMTGFRREDLVGRSSSELLLWATVPGQMETAAGLPELRSIGEVPIGFRTRAGEVRVAHLSVLVISVDGGRHALCTLRDARDPSADERRSILRSELGRILRSGRSWLEMAEAALRAVGECMRWQLGAVWRADPASGVLRCLRVWRAAPGWPDELVKAGRQAALPPGEGLLGDVWRTGAAIWVPDLVEDGRLVAKPSRDRTEGRGWFAVPVPGTGGLVAVLELMSREVRDLDQDLLGTLGRFGSRLGRIAEGATQVEPDDDVGRLELRRDPLLRELARSVDRLNRLLEGVVDLDRAVRDAPAQPAPPPGDEPDAADITEVPAGLTLKAVSERTGIPAATVRTWERRYRFIQPTRSSSGYRLYGEEDIIRILEVKRLLDQGVRISEAMAAIRRRPDGEDG
jgi:PAS domain S-box-containing protein